MLDSSALVLVAASATCWHPILRKSHDDYLQAISQRGSTADSMRDIFRALGNGEKDRDLV